MKPRSAKNKGAKFQSQVREMILSRWSVLTERDVRSTSMGASGEDIQLSELASKLVPLSIECKNVEKLNIWSAYEQAMENKGELEPIVFFKRNRVKPLVAVDAEYFLDLLKVVTSREDQT
jgi:hypothetical protein